VLSDAKMIGEVVKRVSPDTLVVLDGVCSVASEEIRMDDWGIDVVLSATQKGLGTPPGLSVVCASQRALKVSHDILQNRVVSPGLSGIIQILETRKTPVSSYFASWKRWLPIMRAYENGNPMYFATVCGPPLLLRKGFILTYVSVSVAPRELDLRLPCFAHIHY
jgi:alanine-glyoxylate transaminase/serine-glyoxylate transaminase/serine-pyruvate transaminase